ncbi:U21-ctenitoxin-Pn1a-like [Oppia nitens]|uniref:U21-ctenitoxin-Pn1a-like n=1 Tax=Oppia nitens TaxID=1686743 RepID=UPI0023DB3EA0|nr:U21-ctenitoxin-Pn1a-like [Oppia nitens]
MNDQCFRFYTSYDMTRNIQYGRNITDGEMPFIAFIHSKLRNKPKLNFYCSGTILNNWWILTAGHCIYKQSQGYYDEIRVYPGVHDVSHLPDKYSRSLLAFVHPDYQFEYSISHDLGLIKLYKPLHLLMSDSSNGVVGYRKLNAVCLPPEGIRHDSRELAVIGGYGSIGPNEMLKSWPRMGWTVIKKHDEFVNDDNENLIITDNKAINSSIGCAGDSGGPLVQYVKGRAVLIGIFKGYYGTDSDSMCLDSLSSPGVYSRYTPIHLDSYL